MEMEQNLFPVSENHNMSEISKAKGMGTPKPHCQGKQES